MIKNFIKIILKWLGATPMLLVHRRYIGRILSDYYQNKGMTLISIKSSWPEAFDLIRRIKEETDMLLTDLDACQIYMMVKKTEKIGGGDIAEVGVYKGGSAKLIRQATKKPLHLFDTFEGLPEPSKHDKLKHRGKGVYSCSFESVKNYLKNYSNISFYKGVFPYTAELVKNKKFSFVHLDVDLYESTLNCLKFFYPRMSEGGVIISHDYPRTEGVKEAFDEFFEHKSEIIVEPLGTGQCLIIKV